MDELKALADQCICHPASRGIADIEAAGEGLKYLIAKLEAADAAVKQAREDAPEEAKQACKNQIGSMSMFSTSRECVANNSAARECIAAIEALKEAP